MPNTNRVEPYTALADVYRTAGYAAHSERLAPRLVELAFEMNWTGRTLLDLACGTGDAACWFAEHGFRTTGIDQSAAMLELAKARADGAGFDARFVNSDIRTYKPETSFEMITCLGGSLNYMPALRDLEAIFKTAAAATSSGKLFFFDLRTIRGLAQSNGDHVAFDNGEDTLVITRDDFNYETLALDRQYIILRHPDNNGWQRAEETHRLRGYPVQAITKLLSQTGFRLYKTLTSRLEPADAYPEAEMLLFMAVKDGSGKLVTGERTIP